MTQLLRLPEVEQATGLKKTTIYELAASGKFPRPVKLTARASAWPSDEVNAWIEGRRAERDQAA